MFTWWLAKDNPILNQSVHAFFDSHSKLGLSKHVNCLNLVVFKRMVKGECLFLSVNSYFFPPKVINLYSLVFCLSKETI